MKNTQFALPRIPNYSAIIQSRESLERRKLIKDMISARKAITLLERNFKHVTAAKSSIQLLEVIKQVAGMKLKRSAVIDALFLNIKTIR